jgi:hypothetical protein
LHVIKHVIKLDNISNYSSSIKVLRLTLTQQSWNQRVLLIAIRDFFCTPQLDWNL